MPTYSVSTSIRAPTRDVFAYVSDLSRHGEWSADPLEVRLVEGDGGVGSRYESRARSRGKTIAAEIRVLSRDPERVLSFEVADLTGRYVHTFTLEPENGLTGVERRITTAHLSLAQFVLFYIVYPTVKRPNARRALARLKARLEDGGAIARPQAQSAPES